MYLCPVVQYTLAVVGAVGIKEADLRLYAAEDVKVDYELGTVCAWAGRSQYGTLYRRMATVIALAAEKHASIPRSGVLVSARLRKKLCLSTISAQGAVFGHARPNLSTFLPFFICEA